MVGAKVALGVMVGVAVLIRGVDVSVGASWGAAQPLSSRARAVNWSSMEHFVGIFIIGPRNC